MSESCLDDPEEPEAGVVPEAVVVDGPGLVAEPVGVLGGPVGLVGVPGSLGSGLLRVILVEMVVRSIRGEPGCRSNFHTDGCRRVFEGSRWNQKDGSSKIGASPNWKRGAVKLLGNITCNAKRSDRCRPFDNLGY